MRYEQTKDAKLASIINNIRNFPNYSYEPINNFNRNNILKYKNKYVVPKSLQNKIIDYYHEELCHSGLKRTSKSIAISFY